MFLLGSVFLILLIPVALIAAFGIPILIGVFVYRDASKREDCAAWLWALVAALAPSFVGVIIYLIIRNDYPLKGAEPRSEFEQEFQQQTAKPGLPTWAKVLIIIGAVVIGICVLAGIGAAVFGIFNYHQPGMIYSHGF